MAREVYGADAIELRSEPDEEFAFARRTCRALGVISNHNNIIIVVFLKYGVKD